MCRLDLNCCETLKIRIDKKLFIFILLINVDCRSFMIVCDKFGIYYHSRSYIIHWYCLFIQQNIQMRFEKNTHLNFRQYQINRKCWVSLKNNVKELRTANIRKEKRRKLFIYLKGTIRVGRSRNEMRWAR